jgi:hypothetical protein
MVVGAAVVPNMDPTTTSVTKRVGAEAPSHRHLLDK